MKRIVVIIVLIGLVFGIFAKKKEDSNELKLVLDDSKLTTEEAQIAYAKSISGNALSILPNLYTSITSMGTDFQPIIEEFNSAKEDVAYANEIMLQALDLRKDVLAAQADIKAAGTGNAGNVMMEKSKQAEAALQEMADNKTQLNNVQKAWMEAGLLRLGTAVMRETGLVIAIKQYADYAKGLKGMSKAKEAKNVTSATTMATDIPKMLSSQGNTLKNLMAIATANNIEVPDTIKLP